MQADPTTEILKKAILLERRGKAFYRKVAEQTTTGALKQFFETMADEEDRHIEILAEQFKTHLSQGSLAPKDYDRNTAPDAVSQVLTEEVRQKIAAAGFEAAALSAAMSMEERAIKLYAERARTATDAGEKALFQWLADWEGQHLKQLSELDRSLTESIWHDNQFWPF